MFCLLSANTRAVCRQTLLGFVGGVILSYLIFFSMINHLDYNSVKAMRIGSVVAVVLTLGLAFNPTIQCYTLLLLPQLFSKRGRAMLIAYIFVMTLTGPVANTTKNTEVLVSSMHCDAKLAKTVMKELYDIIKSPFVSIKRAVKNVLRSIKKVLVKIRQVMVRMQRLIQKMLKVIESAFSFLGAAAHMCNKEIGTPFDRCVRLFDDAKEDCQAKMGAMKFLCEVTTVVESVCYSVKFMDYVCELIDFVSDSAIGYVKKRLFEFEKEIHNMLYISVKFDHHFHFDTNASKSFHQIGDEVLSDVQQRARHISRFASFAHMFSSFFFCWTLLKVIRYKSKFLTSDRFDNFYINKPFLQIDETRKKFGKESILPLQRKEAQKYIHLSSIRLTRGERLKVARSASGLLISTFHVASMIIVDYCLYWILAKVRYYGRLQGGLKAPPVFTMHVTGFGLVSELIQGIIHAFSPFAETFNIDPTPCLPQPSAPNFHRYLEIVSAVIFCWMLLLFEPYGLRLRQIVMNRFHPDRSHERAAWLYNHLMRRRMTFVKFARRDARQLFGKSSSTEKISCLQWLRARFGHWWICRRILGEDKETFCMLCGSPFKSLNEIQSCVQPTCFGKFCIQCYKELQGTCPICMRPIDYGDLSDVSEAGDSSDDDNAIVLDGFQFVDAEDETKQQFCFEFVRDRSYERTKYF